MTRHTFIIGFLIGFGITALPGLILRAVDALDSSFPVIFRTRYQYISPADGKALNEGLERARKGLPIFYIVGE